MYFLAGDSERWLPSQEAAGSPCSLVYPKTFSMKTNSRIGKRSLDNFPPHLENKMPNMSVPNIEPHGIEKLVECTQIPFNKWVNTSLETREKSLSIGLDENSGLLTQWKLSVVSKKVEFYDYNGKGSRALGQGYHCISTLCVLGQWWTESSTASSFLSWGVSMMFDTWSRRLLAGQSRPPCDKCMGQATVPLLVHQMCLENHDEQIRRRYLINPGVCFLAPQ